MKKIGMLLPVIAGCMWGACGIFVRYLTAFGFNSRTIFFQRATIASIILVLGILVINKQWLKIKLRDFWVFLGCGIGGTLLLNICYNLAIKELSMSLAALLLALAPIFVMIISAFAFKEKVTVRKAIACFLAILGCLFVSGILEGDAGLLWTTYGIIMGLLAGFFYAIYSIFSRVATNKGYNATTISCYSFVFAAIAISPFANWHVLIQFVAVAPVKHSLFMVVHALVAAVLPYVLFTYGMKFVDTGKVAILGSSEPIAATIFGFLVFGEKQTLLSICGIILTLIAIIILCLPEKVKLDKGN